MRILVAVDRHPYSAHTVRQVVRLAANTWADVTLLGLQSKMASKERGSGAASPEWHLDDPLPRALSDYRESFLDHFKEGDCPYIQREFGYELIELRKGVWEELYVAKSAKKSLKARIRVGNPVRGILREAQEEESDLIMLGCNTKRGCEWEEGISVPQKVANEAACSVLVVKEEKRIERIVCCLDHNRVSQQSLEMINQLVTLYQARLLIVGLAEGGNLRTDVERGIDSILRYYTSRKTDPWIELVELSSLDAFVSQEARRGLIALSLGKKSILEKVFPRGKVNRLIKASNASVLILR